MVSVIEAVTWSQWQSEKEDYERIHWRNSLARLGVPSVDPCPSQCY